MNVLPLSSRLGLLSLLLASLAARAAAQDSFGMAATVQMAEEIAGASAPSHRVLLKVAFAGGLNDFYSGDYDNGDSGTYDWQFFTTYSGGSVMVHYGGSSSTEASTGGPVRNGYVLSFPFSYATTNGTPFKGLLAGRSIQHHWWTDAIGRHEEIDVYFQEVTYDSFRLWGIPIDIASVDSRKTYAPPNKDGAYPAVDANAELRHVGFAGWSYRGGLFVGNAAGASGDQSGTARVQCQASDPGGLPSCLYTLSMLHLGTPAAFNSASTQWNGPLSVQARVAGPGSGATVPIGSLTWASALDPATCASVGTLDLSAASNGEYLNFDVGASFPARVLLKATNEAYPTWRYFGGPAYSPPPSLYPDADCKPHLWACQVPIATGTSPTYANGLDWSDYVRPTGGGGTGGGGGTLDPGGETGPGGGVRHGLVRPQTGTSAKTGGPKAGKPVPKAKAAPKKALPTNKAKAKSKGKGR